MRKTLAKLTIVASLSLLLTACFHTQLNGSVGGGSLTITPLRAPNTILTSTTSLMPEDLEAAWGQEFWEELDSFVQMIFVGIATLTPDGINPYALYLVTASGGEDFDPNVSLGLSKNPVPVQGSWHAIVPGQRILKGNVQISALTEALYLQLNARLGEWDDAQVLARLDAAAQLVVGDVDDNGVVNYNDVLRWIRSLHGALYLGKLTAVGALSDAITAGQPTSMLRDLAKNVLGKQRVAMEFDVGTVIVETLNWEAPLTAANFLAYVRDGFYDQMLVHRAIDNFMIQMGLVEVLGENANGSLQWRLKTPGATIVNESSNGLSNVRGTLSMARTGNPDSATAQFFINQVNNTFLDYASSGNPDGYAVFARVRTGMPVVDEIAAERTTTVSGIGSDVPSRGVLLISATLL